MEREQRDPKNTTKNLFAGLSANETDQYNGAGKRRPVSFGRRITYFQPPSSGAPTSTSSYVRMTSPTPTPSPLPPEFFDETHIIFDQFQQQETQTACIDISPIPMDELLAQTEDEYYNALRGIVQEKKRFYDLQKEKMRLIEQLKDRQQKLREKSQTFWANFEYDIKKVLPEVQEANGPK